MVSNILYYLSKQYARLYPQDTFIAVCGIQNKTTTVMMAKSVLSLKYKTITTEPDTDAQSTILQLNPSYKKAIFEMKVFSQQDVDRFIALCHPKIIVFTKADPKVQYDKLLTTLDKDGVVVLNWDDLKSRKLAQDTSAGVIFYGMDPQNCTLWAGNVKIENFKTIFELNLGVERIKIELPVLGLHQIYAALAAASLGITHDIPLTKIKFALESVEPEEHKFKLLAGPNGSFIVDDTFSATPEEIESAIDTLVQIPARRRILVLGEITNPNLVSADDYSHIAQKIYKEKLDFVFLGTGFIRKAGDELKELGFWDERIEANLQNSQMVSRLLKTLSKGDICLIKASKTVRLDEVVKRIAKK